MKKTVKKPIQIIMDSDFHAKFKAICATRGESMKAVIIKAVLNYVNKHKND